MSTTNAVAQPTEEEIISSLVLNGDLSKMSDPQKVAYYNKFCQSLGLNPLTQPFAIIKFQGKERLYAQKDCTEQLRKIHSVSITDVDTKKIDDILIVTVKAQDKTGKVDVSTGALNCKGLSGEALANAIMKAETKAKRRVTLSICGLGMLDETEAENMRNSELLPSPNSTFSLPPAGVIVGPAFTIKYTDKEGIEKALPMANTIHDVSSLYYENRELIEANPDLKAQFTASKNAFKTTISNVNYEDLANLFELKKSNLSDFDRTNAERVLKNKEVANYSKLFNTLSAI